MTYEPTVTDPTGAPISGVLVSVNNENKGLIFQRGTDGNGYANVALFTSDPTDRVTISFLDPQNRFKGALFPDAQTVEQANGKFAVSLVPFV